jgi:hypothetical protein
MTSDKVTAMQAAEAFMRNGHAIVATVEAAVHLWDTRFDLGLSADRGRDARTLG